MHNKRLVVKDNNGHEIIHAIVNFDCQLDET